jgi:rare lipoprotein A
LGLLVAWAICLAAGTLSGTAAAADGAGITQTGTASWYGSGFQSKTTASGEPFDMNDLTAAHRSLPLDSLVRVTNLQNGRSVVVRINDRGPFERGRVIDVSARAARVLGMRNRGVARVRVEALVEGEEVWQTPASAASVGSWDGA